MKEIFNRKSVRSYTDQPVAEDVLKELLKAAMAAPSAGNQQPWEFIVLKEKKTFENVMAQHPYAQSLKEAQVAIVVCGDQSKEKYPGYWVQDCSAATQNILLEAEHLGLGGVWIGVYPMEERVQTMKKVFDLPDSVIPLSIIALGYPAKKAEPVDRYDETRIHYERW